MSAPFRISFCNPCNHLSRVRSHCVNSVIPWIPCGRAPHTNSCPWTVCATFLLWLFVSHSHGTSPKKVPLGGGSCHMSPDKITFRPPKGRAAHCSWAYLLWARSLTNSRQRNSKRANNSALTMLTSSKISHRHCNAFWLNSRILLPLIFSSPIPCQFKPKAW